ncbi:MAG: signal peptidase I [Candidatus Delongbacteria bacterium]|nr:signal peptidase I [Candidatus Delongbacteria bacterium]
MNSKRFKYLIFLSILVFILLSKAVFFEFYRVNSSSMSDTVIPGDFLLINKLIFGTRTPNRATIPFFRYSFSLPSFTIPGLRDIRNGEIIVINNKYHMQTDHNLVKRVAAVEGQTVTLIDSFVFVDGLLYNFKFGKETPSLEINFSDDAQIETFTVPGDRLFVIGDNFKSSYDSRDFGFVDTEDVIGKVSLIYASFDQDEGTRWERFFRVPE